MSHLVLASTPSLSCQSGGLPRRALPGKAPAENTGIESARKPPPDTPPEAEFRAYARERANILLAPERINDAALDAAVLACSHAEEFAALLTPVKLATLRRQGMISGHHRHSRDIFIIGLCAAAEGAGIRRTKARWIVADVFGLDIKTVRKTDRARHGSAPKGDPSERG